MTSIVFLPNTVSAGSISLPPNNLGLVGYWSFEDATGTVATDFSGNGNVGTLTNMDANTDWITGKIGKALDFDGTNDYVDIGTSVGDLSGDFTISLWIKGGAQEQKLILGKSSCWNILADCGWWISTRADGTVWAEWNISTVGYYQLSFGGGILGTNSWHLLQLVRSGSTVYTYTDGALVGTNESSSTSITSTASLKAGKAADGRYLSGILDDVRIYSRALSATEISNLYSRPKRVVLQASSNSIHMNGTVGLWSFNGPDMSGTTAYDRSGYTNTGAIVNGGEKTFGALGQAIRLDGTNDYINIPHSSSLTFTRLQPFSIVVWAESFRDGVAETLVAKYSAPGGANEYGYKLSITADNKLQFEFRAGDTSNRMVVTTDEAVFGTGWLDMYQYSMTYDGSSNASGVKLYANGILKASTATVDSLSGDTTVNNPDLTIGTENGTEYFYGNVDNVTIHDKVITMQELRNWNLFGSGSIYTATTYTPPVPPTPPSTLSDGLVGHWKFDDAAGTTAVDSSGSGNNAAYTNYMADPPVWTSGHHGGAIQFSGLDYFESANNHGLTGAAERSVSFWSKLDYVGAYVDHGMVSMGTKTIGGLFGVISYGGNWYFNRQVDDASTGVLSDTNWNHHVVTFDGSTLTWYLNGTSIMSVVTSTLFTVDTHVFMGINYDTMLMSGILDDVRLYNRAINSSEVTELYNYTY